MGVGDRLHSRQHLIARHEHIAEQHVERLVARLLCRAAHGMSQPQRLLLIHVADRQVADIFHRIGIGVLAALAQKRHQLRVRREMVLNGLLLAAVDDHDLISAGSQTLFHHILDGRTIHHQQHFFGLGLGGRQKAGTEPRRGNECLHRAPFSSLFACRP